MTVQTQTFATVVNNAVAAVQGAASTLINTTIGSVVRAMIEAMGAVVMWLQGIVLQVAALTRLATSTGSDVDSFGADFGFIRLPAYSATGQVTFARYTSTSQAFIQAATANGVSANGQTIWTGGAIVQSADGTQQFMVIPDTTETAYSSTLNGYIIPIGTSSALATVQAVTASASGNVGIGIIATITGGIAFVDTVTNAAAFTNGSSSETDAAFRARFITWVASLSKATKGAILNAVSSIQAGASGFIVENYSYAGAYQPGFFYVIADNGTGYPPSTFLALVGTAVDAVRAAGTSFAIYAPVVVSANTSMTLTTASGYNHASICAIVQTAITNYINALPLGATLPLSRLGQVAYDASPAVTNVSAATINTVSSDLVATTQQVIKAGTVVVN